MLLSELEQGAKVLLLLTIDGKHFEFETIVQGKHKHDVLLEPIRKDQKILNVQSNQVDVDIMYMREDDKPILWKEAKMDCIRHKHKIYYASEAANEGREYNRRGAYRLYIGEEIHARIGHSGREKIVHLKDLSNTGFAFIYNKACQILERIQCLSTLTNQDTHIRTFHVNIHRCFCFIVIDCNLCFDIHSLE